MVLSIVVYSFAFANTIFWVSKYKPINKKSKLLGLLPFLFALLPLVLIAAFRAPSVGTDTGIAYYQYYYLEYGNSYKSIFDSSEFGFIALVKIGYFLFHSYNGFLFIVAFFITFFSLVGLLNSSTEQMVAYSCLLFLAFIYFDSFNIMRQMCAVSLIFAALPLLKKNRLLLFILIVLLSSIFHNSSIICLLIPLFYILRKKGFILIKILLLFILGLLPFILPFVFQQLSNVSYFSKYVLLYSNFQFSVSFLSLSLFIYNLPIYFIVAFYGKELLKKDTFNYVLLMMCFMSAVCALFKLSIVWVSRLYLYFSISYCFLLPECIKLSANKTVLSLALVAYSVLFFIFFYFIRGNSDIVPYKFYF